MTFKSHNPVAFTPLIFISSAWSSSSSLYSGASLQACFGPIPESWRLFSSREWSAIGIAQVLYYHAMRLCGMALSANVTLAVPFITALGPYYLYGGRITALQLLSGLVLAAGIYLSTLGKST